MSDVVERIALALCEASNQAIFHKDVATALSTLRPGDVLPGGLVVVPAEATEQMIVAGDDLQLDKMTNEFCAIQPASMWRAMLAAAKEPDNAE